MESSLSAAQIDFGQPIASTEEKGNRNKGNEEDFPSDQSAIAVTEGEEIEPKDGNAPQESNLMKHEKIQPQYGTSRFPLLCSCINSYLC